MIIENPDAFKSWLTSILEPLCDADPAALAKYVYALVKKDKPLEELRDGMLDQLDVFLQQETKPFVDMLFNALENNEYLKLMEKAQCSQGSGVETGVEQMEPEKEPEVENHDEGNSAPNGASSPARARSPHAALAPAPRHRYVLCRAAKPPPAPAPAPAPLNPLIPHNPHNAHNAHPPREHTLVKVLPLTELLEEPVDQPPRRRDRREIMREDRRRRRSRSWERRARARRHPRDPERDDRRRAQSRSASPRGRFRNRSPPAALDRPNTRSRSRSPVPVREREHDRDRLRPPRDMERDRMSRDREHRDRASRSRDRDRSRDRSRSHSMSPHHAREHPDHYKRRCRDFDEKGYCMRGDLCQWDHGADPVVLEDAALSSVLNMPPPVQEYNPLTPDIWCGAPYPPYPPEHHPPARELIPIPRIQDGPPMGAGPMGAPPRLPAPPKKNFDYNRLGRCHAGRAGAGGAGGALNCSLEVKKVPRGLNDITHLNNHFGKFGKIVNIQVCFEGDPEGALITFSNHTEASVAYKSTEAVLNNRFIKVFWHNPENKQENMAPSNQQKPNNPQPGSHNKVLINRENIKATADIKQQALQAEKAKEAKEALANGTEKKKEVKPVEKSKQVMEMHKRAQALLQTQLQQQVLLIQRLEGSNVTGPQRQVLMEAINSAQEGIEKLRKELVAYNRTLKLMQANARKPKTREEAQKEILDAELDMFTKQQEGQDITDLQKRIADLRRQMAMQFPVHPAMHRPHLRGGRFITTRFPRAPFVNQSVDHRPRALLVSGFEADEAAALSAHFAQFGEIARKELNPTVPELVVVYRARAHAELAAQQGRHYNDRTLTITWVANPKAFSSTPRPASPRIDAPEPPKEITETAAETADALLRFDEDDDDEEDRSWRR